jgi:tetratricopeptide (TPR) repeat protein
MVSAASLKIPSNAHDEFSKGMKDMQANKLEDAKKHFEKAIKYYPSYDWAYNNLGVVEIQLKNSEAAKQAFLKAVALNDKNADAMGNLGQMKFEENDYQGAKELLEKSLTAQPNNPKNLLMLALTQARTGDYASSLTNAEKVHQGDIDRFPYAHFLAAQVREQMGDHAGAERQYQAYLKEAPDGPEASHAQEGLQRVEAKK